MMLKNKVIVIALLLYVAVMLTLLPAVSAYMVQQTPVAQNVFTPGQVSCTVVEHFEQRNEKEYYKDQIQIQNTSNTDVYIRVQISTYWVDSKGAIVGKASDALNGFADKLSDDWIQDTQNPNMYYYKYPVKKYVEGVSGLTTNLLKNGSVIILKQDVEEYNNGTLSIQYEYNQVVEIFAEAIQANPTRAVTQAWKRVNINNDGILSLKD